MTAVSGGGAIMTPGKRKAGEMMTDTATDFPLGTAEDSPRFKRVKTGSLGAPSGSTGPPSLSTLPMTAPAKEGQLAVPFLMRLSLIRLTPLSFLVK